MNYIQGDYVMPWFTKIAARLLATVLGIGALSACSVNLSLPSNTTSDNNASQQKKVDTSEDSTKEKSQNSQEESTEKPADLTGTWKTDANEGSDLIAKITNDTITITWAQSQASEESSLYWKGPPTKAGDYTWTSQADSDAMSKAVGLTAQESTKKFTYSNGQISFDVTAPGTTISKTHKLIKQ